MAAFPWSLLGIVPTGDARAIRSAYAARIKMMDLDADVEGYAQLRSARDTALRIAKSMPSFEAVSEVVPETAPGHETSPPQWLHAAPTLPNPGPGEWPIDPALAAHIPAMEDAPLFERLAADFVPDETAALAEAPPPVSAHPFTPPLIEGYTDRAPIGTDALQSPFARLAALLDGDAAEPLDEAQAAQALTLLDTVLDALHWSPIDQQGEMEDWLAGLLARSWPRSAPVLERTTAALGWEAEWGRIGARETVDYLGARLRGYRFQRKVQDKGHRYHKAWAELHRAGSAGALRFLRASGGDVRGLLAGVRKHFPELEDHFDPQRVASWEEAKSWPTGLIVLGGLILLAFLLTIGDNPKAPQARQDAFVATVTEVFGPEHDPAWLSSHEPELAGLLARRIRFTEDGAVDEKATVAGGLELVRARTYLDGRLLTGDDFETTMKLRLALLEAAKAQGTEACRQTMLRSAPPPGTPVPAQVRDKERQFAAALAQRGMLKAPEKAPARSASVPAQLVREVIAASGLSKEQVSAAMRNDADPNRCVATISLLKAALDWKGKERHDILMTL